MFSSKFCEISKNTFYIEHVWWLLLTMIIIVLTESYLEHSQTTAMMDLFCENS